MNWILHIFSSILSYIIIFKLYYDNSTNSLIHFNLIIYIFFKQYFIFQGSFTNQGDLAKTIIEKLILSGSLSIYFLIYMLPFTTSYSGVQAPWFTAHFFIPSSSQRFPPYSINEIKWESQSDWTADWPCCEAPLCSCFSSLLFSNSFPFSSGFKVFKFSKNVFK